MAYATNKAKVRTISVFKAVPYEVLNFQSKQEADTTPTK
jgi:hypothetical protein